MGVGWICGAAAYGRTPAGQVDSVIQWGGGPGWGYDADGQVVSGSNPTTQFGYDAASNPIDLAGVTQAFNASGELCWAGDTAGECGNPPAGATTYDFDVNGQRTGTGSDTFGYDGTGAMTSASPGSSSYVYSAGGLRTSKTTGGATTVFSWDDTANVPQLIQDGNDYYIYGPDGLPVERLGAAGKRWLANDGFGSVALAFDTNAEIAGSRSYDTWGNITGHTGDPVSLGWQSQYQDDETGLYYLRNRYYDPATGQFTTPDPLESLTGDRYTYAGNDPVNRSDPLGLWWGEVRGTRRAAKWSVGSTTWQLTRSGLLNETAMRSLTLQRAPPSRPVRGSALLALLPSERQRALQEPLP